MLHRLLCSLLLLLVSSNAWAWSACDYYRRNFPELYRVLCEDGMLSVRPSGATSTLGDSLKFNPAALPTSVSSYGVEVIGSYLRNNPLARSADVGLIKGFQRFGAGLSTSDNNTFYSNDVLERESGPGMLSSLAPHEPALGNRKPNVALGVATALWDEPYGSTLKFGVSARYNKTTNRFGGGPGLTFESSYLTFGTAMTREKIASSLPPLDLVNATANLHFLIVELDYKLLKNLNGPSLRAIQIATCSVTIPRVLITGAIRRVSYQADAEAWQKHLAVQVQLTPKLSTAFLYNYLPGATSLGLQFFL